MTVNKNNHKTGRKKRNKLSDQDFEIMDRYYQVCSKETRLARIQRFISHPKIDFRHRVQDYVIDNSVYQYICLELSVTDIANSNNINVSMLYDNIDFILKVANDFFRRMEKNV